MPQGNGRRGRFHGRLRGSAIGTRLQKPILSLASSCGELCHVPIEGGQTTFPGQVIRRILLSREIADYKWIARYRLRLSNVLRLRDEVDEALELLDRQHPKRVPQPRGRSANLAPEPVEEQGREDQSEECLGLSATGWKPQDVDRLSLLQPPRFTRTLASQ